jgi:hypothetical protein
MGSGANTDHDWPKMGSMYLLSMSPGTTLRAGPAGAIQSREAKTCHAVKAAARIMMPRTHHERRFSWGGSGCSTSSMSTSVDTASADVSEPSEPEFSGFDVDFDADDFLGLPT